MQKVFKILFLLFIFSGLNAQSINTEILSKLTPEELESLNLNQGNNDLFQEQEVSEPTLLENEEEEPSLVFGFDFIKTMPTSTSATPDLPVPNDYRLGMNDEILIILSGAKEDIYRLKIGLDGTILMPEIGIVQVLGETFIGLKEKVKNLVDISFVGVNVNISIVSLNAKKITIVGAVKNPGSYLVNPFTTISNSLSYSGGLEDYASLRNLQLVKPNGETFSYDLYDYLVFGNRLNDIVVDSGDTILVPGTNNFVEVSGQVLRPFIYEYKDSDRFDDVINFALGFTNNANIESLYVDEKINRTIVSSEFQLNEEIGIRDLHAIYIPNDSFKNDYGIKIRGESVRERVIQKGKFLKLEDLVQTLNFSNNVYPFYSTLEQTDESGLLKERYIFSILDPNTYKDIIIKNNVLIQFFSRSDIDSFQEELKNIIVENLSEEITQLETQQDQGETLDLSPSLALSPEEGTNFNISDIKRLIFGSNSYLAPMRGAISAEFVFNFFGPNVKLKKDAISISNKDGLSKISFDEIILSSNIDQISFPEAGIKSFEVQILGQVENPGNYLVNGSITLDDLYAMAGGLTKEASEGSIILSREAIRAREKESIDSSRKIILDSLISQIGNPLNTGGSDFSDVSSILSLVSTAEDIDYPGRLSGDISPGSESAQRIFLAMGDEIYVPSKSNTVTIIGEVLQPTTTLFLSELTIDDYITKAGQMTEYADKDKIYVIKSDGTSMPVASRMFTKSYNPEPGDTIVIPRDLDRIKTIPLVSVATKIISDIAFAAASLNTIRN